MGGVLAGQFPRDDKGNLAPCTGDQSKHKYEGNVALSLLALEQCPEYTRQELVDTLAQSPGQIHAFDEFRARLQDLHGDCLGLFEPFSESRTELQAKYGKRLFLNNVKKELSALKAVETRLKNLRDKALEDVRKISPCWETGNCIPLLVNQILPSVLGAELAATRIVRTRSLRSFRTS